jgi:hypothetical protein
MALLLQAFYTTFAETCYMKIVKARAVLFTCLAILWIFGTISVSCKKSKEVNRDEELIGTVWAGEYQLTSGGNLTPQAFSIELKPDSTATWHDINKSENGTWLSKGGGYVQLTFGTGKVLADLSVDSTVTFANITTTHNWKINSLYRSAVPTVAALQNTTWKGKMGINDYTINIRYNRKLTFLIPALSPDPSPEAAYDIAGAGIKFSVGLVKQYAGFIRNNSIKGTYYLGASIAPWNATKQ